ncbi:hypothetical protein SAMN05421821_11282 [Mucilaginibacter lappiensis]|uniref:Natural product n=1 Tax=Mucilaginibacter lappiensis TaxID=354630 RepID=A0ABR6PNW3_9SPHI|nr:hypothetical protein [Mucilaginibacter lappiensis]MBB6111461.1 hypothetical protein [Mucilaginibacter lappiensis]SIR79668.1 hypothetical protein SAMN05421821_11282 [Mucilaginibacter lappiensis]
MKRLKVNTFDLGVSRILTRNELKNILGGILQPFPNGDGSNGTTTCNFMVVAPDPAGNIQHVAYKSVVVRSDGGCSGFGSGANSLCVSYIENQGLPNCHYHCDGC